MTIRAKSEKEKMITPEQAIERINQITDPNEMYDFGMFLERHGNPLPICLAFMDRRDTEAVRDDIRVQLIDEAERCATPGVREMNPNAEAYWRDMAGKVRRR